MKEHYLFIDSKKTKGHNANTGVNFSVDFPHHIDLSSGNWEIGLAEIDLVNRNTNSCKSIFICCDIISTSFQGNNSGQILRFITCNKVKINMQYNPIFYFDVLPKHFNKMNIYILNDEGSQESLSSEPLHCTLHLREKT